MISIWYGTEQCNIDITEKFKELFINDDIRVVIPENTIFNDLFGDPIINVTKVIRIIYNTIIYNISEYDTIDKKLEINDLRLQVWYGTEEGNIIITDKFKELFIKDQTKVIIPANTNFNDLFGDPILNVSKVIRIIYKTNIYNIGEYDTINNTIEINDISKSKKIALYSCNFGNYRNELIHGLDIGNFDN